MTYLVVAAGLLALVCFCLVELAELREARHRREASDSQRSAAEAYADLVGERPSEILAAAIEHHWTAVGEAGRVCPCDACKLWPSDLREMRSRESTRALRVGQA